MRMLRDLETESNHHRDAYGDEFEEKIGALGKVFGGEGEQSLALLRAQVKPWPSVRSLFKRDETPGEIEKVLSSAVEDAIGELTDAVAQFGN